MAHLRPSYLMPHGPFLVYLVFANEKACWQTYRMALFTYTPYCRPCIWYAMETVMQGCKIHSFIMAISIVPIQVLYYSEALPTTARILYRSFTPKRTGNCRSRTCPRSLHSGSRTH